MPYVLVGDFKGGIDTRRTVVTSVPGTAVSLTNAHITRGGEIEKRRAFKLWATLPDNTHGLAAGGGRVFVFGSEDVTLPTTLPAGLNYVRFQHHLFATSDIASLSCTTANGDATITTTTTANLVPGMRVSNVTGTGIPTSPVPTIKEVTDGTHFEISANATATETVNLAFDFTEAQMTAILGKDFFDGKVYASVQFTDGVISHYWDGYTDTGTPAVSPTNRIDDWYEGRARTFLTVTGGTATATAATADFTVTGGGSIPGNNLKNLRINDIDILTGPIAHTGSNDTTGAAIAAAINALTSTPNYTASAASAVVTITAVTRGTSENGLAVTSETEGTFGATADGTLTGGEDNAVTVLTVDGKTIISNPIIWEISHSYTASKIKDEINATFTDPEWEATSPETSANVNIIAKSATGSATFHNDLVLGLTASGNMTVTNGGITSGGQDYTGSTPPFWPPGAFVRVFDNQMHSLSDDSWHTSALEDPTSWTSGTGESSSFRILSNHSRGAEELLAIAPYFDNLAVFGKDVIQIWSTDPTPSNYSRVQILNNTGTIAEKSVVEIGDSDVFYLSRSGIRSLKARDSSNAAYVGDIGNPIDTLINDATAELQEGVRGATGIVDPRDGRYLLALGDKVYVFSYFPSSKISAWSVYEPGFTITDWAFDGTELLCRSGNNIYSLGGVGNDEYDTSTVTVQLPFLDADKPATSKMWTGLDAVCSSDWVISVGTDPTDITVYETAATINKPTYGMGRVSLSSASSHIALRMENSRAGAATLGNIAVHYELNEAG